jgi:group II intron reverse transcriptase/maturase
MSDNQQSAEANANEAPPTKRRRDMTSAERVGVLREGLYRKAKQEPGFKFYILYDKMFIPYMLREAYARVKANKGSAGIDNQTCADIENYGLDKFLSELGEDLRQRTYKPQAVKRVWIDKSNGTKRPLGIPTIRDRIAQTVCLMIVEPIFEADFEDCSYGFRPGRSAKDAMTAIKEHLRVGRTEVFDADLSSYFDTIPHDKLMKVLQGRISDPRMLKLIMLWLKCPVYEDGQFKGGKKQKVGTPQGGVISPLLANIYMHLVDRLVNNRHSVFYKQGIKIVRYADDFVLMGSSITQEALEKLRSRLAEMDLTLNEQKTRLIKASKTAFDFLGFTVRCDKDLYADYKRYWNIIPSKKSEYRIRGNIRDFLHHSGHLNPQLVADGLNAKLRGSMHYFDIPNVSYPTVSKKKLRFYLIESLYNYYNRKSQRRSRLYGTQAFDILVAKHGLIDPTKYRVRTSL